MWANFDISPQSGSLCVAVAFVGITLLAIEKDGHEQDIQ